MPIKSLTDRTVRALAKKGAWPRAGRVEYFDKSLTGFSLRVTSAGRLSWNVVYRVKGRPLKRRLVLGAYPAMPLGDARQRAREALRAAERGGDPAQLRKQLREAPTIRELASRYVEHAKTRKRSWSEDQRVLTVDLVPKVGRLTAPEVARRDVRELLAEIVARGAPIQANRVLEIVRRFFNWAIGEEYLEVNPCLRIPKPSAERRRERVLSPDEIRAVWAALPAMRSPVIEAAHKVRLLTGARGAEVLGMLRSELEPDGWWNVPAARSKNKRQLRIYLTVQARSVIAELDGALIAAAAAREARRAEKAGVRPDLDALAREIAEREIVFPGPRGAPLSAVHKAHDRLIKAAGVEDFTPHDLRRTAASNWGAMGINRLLIGKLLGHVDRSVTAVYDVHEYAAEKRAALEAWAGRLDQIVSGQPAPSNVIELVRA